MDERQVSRKVSQALLSLLLIRETQFTHSEFAVRAGLGGESIPLALRVSEQAGLLHSIPHGVKHEAMDCMVNPPHPTPVLPDTIQARDQEGNDVGGAGASNGVTAKTIGSDLRRDQVLRLIQEAIKAEGERMVEEARKAEYYRPSCCAGEPTKQETDGGR